MNRGCTLCSLSFSLVTLSMLPSKGLWMVGGWKTGRRKALQQSTMSLSEEKAGEGSSTVMSCMLWSLQRSEYMVWSNWPIYKESPVQSNRVQSAQSGHHAIHSVFALTSMTLSLVMRKYEHLTNTCSLAIRIAVKQVDAGKPHNRVLQNSSFMGTLITVKWSRSHKNTHVHSYSHQIELPSLFLLLFIFIWNNCVDVHHITVQST